MAHNIYLSSYDKRQINDMAKKDYPVQYIARKLHISIGTVYRYLSPEYKQGQKKWSVEEKKLLVKLRDNGLSYPDIAKKLEHTANQCTSKYRYIKSKGELA